MGMGEAMNNQPTTRAKAYGKHNAYTCGDCRRVIFTFDVDDGVTPFTIPCLADANCRGWMRSSCYRVQAGVVPHYVWRKPTPQEYAKLGRGSRQHVDQGGLEIYAATMLDPANIHPRPFKP